MESVQTCDLSYTQNRELSWLKFNERVLAEASDPTVPLIERLRFVSIFTSNLDEFFMVRVGSLVDLNVLTPDDMDNKSGLTPSEQLSRIYEAVRPMIARRDEIYRELMGELSAAGVSEISYEGLTDSQRAYVHDYYKENIRPLLSPQIIDRSHPFPHLKNKALYAAALLSLHGKAVVGIVDIPKIIPPILMLPGGQVKFVRTESVVAAHIKEDVQDLRRRGAGRRLRHAQRRHQHGRGEVRRGQPGLPQLHVQAAAQARPPGARAPRGAGQGPAADAQPVHEPEARAASGVHLASAR